MPDIPPQALAAAAEALNGTVWVPGEPVTSARVARIVLDAAARVLAEEVARKILAHAERQHPRDPDHVPTAWHRHFSIAARVAAGAFDTREDQMRMTAEAIKRGHYIACDIPEVPGA